MEVGLQGGVDKEGRNGNIKFDEKIRRVEEKV